VVILCPAGLELPAIGPEEALRNITLFPTPAEPTLIVLAVQGALQRRKAKAELQHRLQERDDVLGSISEVFFSVDHEYRYTFFNEKAQRVGGKSSEEVIGRNMWEMFPQLKDTDFQRKMEQVAATRQILIAEYLGPITGGWFEMRIYPSAGGVSALFVDISARKKAEASLQKAQEELQAANTNLERAVEERTAQLRAVNEQLEDLLYSIAHDLRAPLRGMEGFARAFADDFAPSLGEEAKEYSRRMTASAVFMDRRLNDLLELSRVTRMDIAPESVSLDDVCAKVVAGSAAMIAERGAQVHRAPDLGRVRADRALLALALDHLLDNALKFTRQEDAPEIHIWSEAKDAQGTHLFVKDNGIGIDARYHEKVFRIFERLNGSDYGGTGIGLALARRAVERMQGRLDFVSTVGAGTTFRLELPKG
jgi:PAS domain S-box-containing protein